MSLPVEEKETTLFCCGWEWLPSTQPLPPSLYLGLSSLFGAGRWLSLHYLAGGQAEILFKKPHLPYFY
jgi:hypothetical protein